MEAQRDTGCLTREHGTVHSILPDRVAVRCAVTDSYRHVAEALVAKPIQVGQAGRAAAPLRVTKQQIGESHPSETHVVRASRRESYIALKTTVPQNTAVLLRSALYIKLIIFLTSRIVFSE